MTWSWLTNLRQNLQRQPWLFIYYAVAFGGLQYLIQRDSVAAAVLQGLAFAVLMSGWSEWRRRRSRSRSQE